MDFILVNNIWSSQWFEFYHLSFHLFSRPEFDDPKSGQEDTLRQSVMLAEEFLNLLITILSEYTYNENTEMAFHSCFQKI